jgi:hypothetical protein
MERLIMSNKTTVPTAGEEDEKDEPAVGKTGEDGTLRSSLLDRKNPLRLLLSERTALRPIAPPIISLLLERTDSLRSMATSMVGRAMSLRSLIKFVSKKSVTFGDIHNKVHRSLSRDDYSKEELDAAFYCRGDYDSMKKKRRSAENFLERSAQDITEEVDDENEDTECGYGLETKIEAVARSSLTTKSIVAVLEEHEMQQGDDQTTDPDLLASIYLKFSASSHKAAHERALKLEVSIRCYIAPCRWAPANKKNYSRKSWPMGKAEHTGRPAFAKQLSAPLPSAAPIQPVRESSFRWRASKQPIRDPSTMGKSEHRRPTFAKQMSAPGRVLLSSAAPIQNLRTSSAPKQPTREVSFEREAPNTDLWVIQDSLPQATLSDITKHQAMPLLTRPPYSLCTPKTATMQPLHTSSISAAVPIFR